MPYFLLIGEALAEHRLALVIGNDAYKNIPPLERATADAKSYAALLREKGFQVTDEYNTPFIQMKRVIARFAASIQPGDTAVFVYSGHGWSDANKNYLVGVDTPNSLSEDELRSITIPVTNGVDGILDQIGDKGAKLRVAIIDACRDNPFSPPPGLRGYSVSRGLAAMTQPPNGTFLVFSASAGQGALDALPGDNDPNSVFTRVFIPLLRKDLPLLDAIKESQEKVSSLASLANHEQMPAYIDDVLGETCLSPVCKKAEPAPETVSASADVDDPELRTFIDRLEDMSKTTLSVYVKKAKSGDADAAAAIGKLYMEGSPSDSIKQDYHKAALFFKFASEQGNAAGQAGLGILNRRGWGMPQNDYEAARLLTLAAAKGNAMAEVALGVLYREGAGGLPKDDAKAMEFYKRAADQGSAAGAVNLANMYAAGAGALPSEEREREAARLYKLAADQGNDGGETGLAVFYANGRGGLPKREDEAARLFKMAADQGNEAAKANLEVLRV